MSQLTLLSTRSNIALTSSDKVQHYPDAALHRFQRHTDKNHNNSKTG